MVVVVIVVVPVVVVGEVVSIAICRFFFFNLALNLYKGHFFYHNLNDHRKQRVEKTIWCKGDEFQSAVPILPLTVTGSFIIIFSSKQN